jgi:hypothetical protein
MFKLIAGSLVSAVAMFLAAFLYFAGPIGEAGYAQAGENESALIQEALKTNLASGGTGTYVIPYPGTQTGTTLYGNGPVATVHFNSNGFPLDSTDGMLWGFLIYLVSAILMAAALSQLDRRVVDFKSRATIVICFAMASATMMVLSDPIFQHWDWRYAIFAFIGNVLILSIGGLILARWFMPVKAELAPSSSPAQKVEETSSGEEVPAADGSRL